MPSQLQYTDTILSFMDNYNSLLSEIGVANGLATLDASSTITISQLPLASTTGLGVVELRTAATGSVPVVLSEPDLGVANGVATLDANSRVLQSPDSATGLSALSTAHGAATDLYGPTTIHGGVGITVNSLLAPSGLAAANATSGTVAAYLSPNTSYEYTLTAVSYSGVETNACASVSVTTGATAYPVNLSWTAPSSDTEYVNVYKDGSFLIQLNGASASYQDAGSVATTTRTAPALNLTGALTANGPVQLNDVFGVPNLTALPSIVGASGTVVVVNDQWYISNGTAWVAMAASVSKASATVSGTVELPASAGSPTSPVTPYRATSVQEIEITGTTAQVVASYAPVAQGNFSAKMYIRVVTAATVVTITVTYTSASGAQTYSVISSQTLAVGDHTFIAPFFNATTASAIDINVTAGTANQCYVSAAIVGE